MTNDLANVSRNPFRLRWSHLLTILAMFVLVGAIVNHREQLIEMTASYLNRLLPSQLPVQWKLR